MLLAKCADDFAGVGQVEKALSIYDQILKGVPRLEPAVRGEIRFREGLSRYASSFERAREENLALAVEAFEEAIRLFKVEADPIEHAQAQNGLGISLVRLSEIEGDGVPDPSAERRGGGDGQNLNRAILAFEAALKIYAAEGGGAGGGPDGEQHRRRIPPPLPDREGPRPPKPSIRRSRPTRRP